MKLRKKIVTEEVIEGDDIIYLRGDNYDEHHESETYLRITEKEVVTIIKRVQYRGDEVQYDITKETGTYKSFLLSDYYQIVDRVVFEKAVNAARDFLYTEIKL